MAEAPHGTAPALTGKDIANPMAMMPRLRRGPRTTPGRAGAPAPSTASRAIYEAMLEAVGAGIRTPDLGGHSRTSEMTQEVVDRVRTKLEVWSSLGSSR